MMMGYGNAGSRVLEVHVAEARELPGSNLTDKIDPYAILSIDGDEATKMQTASKNDAGSDVKWDQRFSIPGGNIDGNNRLNVVILDYERVGDDRKLCSCAIPLDQLFNCGSVDAWYPLFKDGKPGAGKIHLAMDLRGYGQFQSQPGPKGQFGESFALNQSGGGGNAALMGVGGLLAGAAITGVAATLAGDLFSGIKKNQGAPGQQQNYQQQQQQPQYSQQQPQYNQQQPQYNQQQPQYNQQQQPGYNQYNQQQQQQPGYNQYNQPPQYGNQNYSNEYENKKHHDKHNKHHGHGQHCSDNEYQNSY